MYTITYLDSRGNTVIDRTNRFDVYKRMLLVLMQHNYMFLSIGHY
jgi:hypothetical protein